MARACRMVPRFPGRSASPVAPQRREARGDRGGGLAPSLPPSHAPTQLIRQEKGHTISYCALDYPRIMDVVRYKLAALPRAINVRTIPSMRSALIAPAAPRLHERRWRNPSPACVR